ncbi:MAG TPA: long-chain fatty acid--CoA ligase [Isosphaeraceae bacterium]|nr:long-chain fatty acid--CoA ligase [Isosphaeraceae bacterium]
MSGPWLPDRMRAWGGREALIGDGWSARYDDLLAGAARWSAALEAAGVGPGRVVAFDGDCCDRTVALLLALIERACIAVPLASAAEGQRAEFLATAQAEFLVDDLGDGPGAITVRGDRPGHPLIDALAASGHSGLVLFSSGSTGRAKAILHDLDRLLEKFEAPRPGLRILSFLLLDHIGGINTILYGLAHGGTVVTIRDRRPETICRAIERGRVEVLPTSPTFLNLLLLSGVHRQHDLASLKLITYGTELMPASTLERLGREFPGVRLQQTYGLSELGILRSKSRDGGSLWVKVGGEGYETKVVNGVLWIRARSALLGYLNAPSPFDAEGWFNTQDAVVQDGEWLRFLGRTSEIINVGGQKVYPAEVESILLEMDNVLDATVRGERNPIVGQCVVARVNLRQPEPPPEFKARMRRHCRGRLAPYMVPVKVEIAASEQYNARCKRMRGASGVERE